MNTLLAEPVTAADGAPDDESLVDRARQKDRTAFELLMRRHNQRVYRVVRSILRDATEIEDVMQQAYLAAFLHLDQFTGEARWSTWVCRIAINEALGRVRQRARFVSLEASNEVDMMDAGKSRTPDPERAAAGRELHGLVEEEVDRLPEIYRTVLMMRGPPGLPSTSHGRPPRSAIAGTIDDSMRRPGPMAFVPLPTSP